MATKVNSKISSRINRSLVLGLLRQRQPISRVELAEISGLGRSAITEILKSLMALGLVDELEQRETETHTAGRPRTLLRIRTGARSVIGVAIDISHATALVADLEGRELARVRSAFSPGSPPEQVVANLLTALRQKAHAECGRCAAIAISAPGAIDSQAGVIEYNMFNKWRDIPLKKLVEKAERVPVLVENNAKAAAIGERAALLAAGTPTDTLLYLYLRQVTGTTILQPLAVGGAVILRSSVWHGASNYAGEISMAVNRKYHAHMEALVRAHPQLEKLSLAQLQQLEGKAAPPAVKVAIREFGLDLGHALGLVATFLDVPFAILHLAPAEGTAELFAETARAFSESFDHFASQRARLVLPRYGEDAQVRGLIDIALGEIFVNDIERTSILLQP